MPDWSYRTLLQPLLFSMPGRSGERLVRRVLQSLGRWPGAYVLIDALGHMRPPTALSRDVHGRTYSTPVGLGADVDPDGRALGAFERFGVSVLSVGPVALGNASDWTVR